MKKKCGVKFWFPNRTNQVLFASDDLDQVRTAVLALRSIECQGCEDFQFELVDSENRVGFPSEGGGVEWKEIVSPEEDFFVEKEAVAV